MRKTNPYTPPESSDTDARKASGDDMTPKWWHFEKRPAHGFFAAVGAINGLIAAYYWNSTIGLTLPELKSRHLAQAMGHTILSVVFLVVALTFFIRHARKQ